MFSAKGIVLEGKKRGSKIGFPTANIAFHNPNHTGIFAGRASYAGRIYGAAIYIDPVRKLLEAHLMDFQGDLYGRELSVEILKKIRDSSEFTNDADLRAAIAGDISTIREYLAHNR